MSNIALAEASATQTLAAIAVERLALANEPALASVKETLTGIFGREEAAVKSALGLLKAAGADRGRQAAAVAALNAADDEATRYFQSNPSVKDLLAKRAAMLHG